MEGQQTQSYLSGRVKPTKIKKLQSSQKRKRNDVDENKLQQAVDNLVSNSANLACTSY